MEKVLTVSNLKTQFFIYEGVVKAIDDVSFTLRKGEVLGIVGETGCGKSVTAYSITRLIPDPPGRIISGKIMLGNLNLLKNLDKEAKIIQKKRIKIVRNRKIIRKNDYFLNRIRGKYISMIFQEPMAALNPVYTVEDQIVETLFLHNLTKMLKIIKSSSKHLSELVKFRDQKEISYFFDDDVGEELKKIVSANKGQESILKHLDMLIESSKLYLKKEAKYEKMLIKSIENDKIEEKLLSNISQEEEDQIIKILTKESKKINLIKISKKLKRNTRDPLIIEARREALFLLESVNIPNAYRVLKSYPHELSGGMLQRVVISISLSNNPYVLIADEPTTALDVTVQAQILEILKNLQKNNKTSIILITHDLGVIAEMSDRVAVMYAGNIVESASTDDIFHNPKHPYTIGLLQSIPRIDNPDKKLKTVPGSVPNLINPPSGCRFNPRCPLAFDKCKLEKPPTIEVSDGHTVACHLFSGKEVYNDE